MPNHPSHILELAKRGAEHRYAELKAEIELLVKAGFTPVEAIHIATQNGAEALGQSDRIGTIAKGKQADLVVLEGNPLKQIADVEKVKIVFRDGVGFDPRKLLDSVRGGGRS